MAIKSELDLLKMEKENGFYGSKGNSLFGEVEDKRVEAERKLISLQVRHESLEKTHSLIKQRYTKLRVGYTLSTLTTNTCTIYSM